MDLKQENSQGSPHDSGGNWGGSTTDNADDPNISGPLQAKPVDSTVSFPWKLYDMLNPLNADVVEWLPDGKAFQIKDSNRLAEEILPRYFKHNKITSFQRQLNLYGFKCSNKTVMGPPIYCHPYFVRGHEDWLYKVRRFPTKSSHLNNNQNGANGQSNNGEDSYDDEHEETPVNKKRSGRPQLHDMDKINALANMPLRSSSEYYSQQHNNTTTSSTTNNSSKKNSSSVNETNNTINPSTNTTTTSTTTVNNTSKLPSASNNNNSNNNNSTNIYQAPPNHLLLSLTESTKQLYGRDDLDEYNNLPYDKKRSYNNYSEYTDDIIEDKAANSNNVTRHDMNVKLKKMKATSTTTNNTSPLYSSLNNSNTIHTNGPPPPPSHHTMTLNNTSQSVHSLAPSHRSTKRIEDSNPYSMNIPPNSNMSHPNNTSNSLLQTYQHNTMTNQVIVDPRTQISLSLSLLAANYRIPYPVWKQLENELISHIDSYIQQEINLIRKHDVTVVNYPHGYPGSNHPPGHGPPGYGPPGGGGNPYSSIPPYHSTGRPGPGSQPILHVPPPLPSSARSMMSHQESMNISQQHMHSSSSSSSIPPSTYNKMNPYSSGSNSNTPSSGNGSYGHMNTGGIITTSHPNTSNNNNDRNDRSDRSERNAINTDANLKLLLTAITDRTSSINSTPTYYPDKNMTNPPSTSSSSHPMNTSHNSHYGNTGNPNGIKVNHDVGLHTIMPLHVASSSHIEKLMRESNQQQQQQQHSSHHSSQIIIPNTHKSHLSTTDRPSQSQPPHHTHITTSATTTTTKGKSAALSSSRLIHLKNDTGEDGDDEDDEEEESSEEVDEDDDDAEEGEHGEGVEMAE